MRLPLTMRASAVVLAAAAAIRLASRLLSNRRLDGRVALITGGSRGLGLALAREYAARGARVVLFGRDAASLERAAARLREQGAAVHTVAGDVRDARALSEAVRESVERFGRLDVLVNNAGVIAVGPRDAMLRADYEAAIDTHFWGAYNAVEAALPVFERQGEGRIVNISSIGGKVSVPHLLPYSVSKFALAGYSEGLRAALKPQNVKVTTVCPGLMRTGSPRNATFKGQHRKEYAWFAISDALPGLTIAAASAARSIVEASIRGDAEIVLSLPAQALAIAHGVFPGLTSDLLQAGTRLLPGFGGIATGAAKGHQSESPLTDSPLTALSRKAEREYNQF